MVNSSPLNIALNALFLAVGLVFCEILAPGVAGAGQWQPSPGHQQVPIWPGTPPDEERGQPPETMNAVTESPVAAKPWTEIVNVSQPTMTVYTPKKNNSGAAVVVFPGGGYKILAIDLEGTEVCDWLTSRGLTCVLLKYRVPDSGPHWEEKVNATSRRKRHSRSKTRSAPSVSCVFVRRNGISIRTRSASWVFQRAGILSRQ